MTPEELAVAEVALNAKFAGDENWDVNPYLSPAEKDINKPILPKTDPITGRMGHARNWVGPDTGLLQAVFWSFDGNKHTGVFTNVKDAIDWLFRQDPTNGKVEV